ncbi:unnamed protein product [Bursaphelenchus xylophilus]|uniref:(pine wood nematode) hypothetical protein n=1 Tax=Bursaphelenchus xylophilus TaxID=6326 RepID=A0A7I8WGE5_BURXY|nr:unnamed protein product [Bursaphelenchus xylophilus]CAG9111221.1 unnamed protein product [Bursaphelenchus xylophilus]
MEVKRREFLDAKIKELKASVDKAVPFEDKLYNQPRLSDLVVSVGEQKFYVSKHQLAKKSPVFETMFLSDFKEAKEGVLNLHDEDPEAVEAMLKHIYMNTKIKDFELARRVVPLAHRYELLALKDECELILLEKVTFKSAIEVLYLANQLDLKLLFIKSSQVLYFESNLNNTEGTNQTDDKEIEHLCKCLSTPSGSDVGTPTHMRGASRTRHTHQDPPTISRAIPQPFSPKHPNPDYVPPRKRYAALAFRTDWSLGRDFGNNHSYSFGFQEADG